MDPLRLEMLKMKLQILKLKADGYMWSMIDDTTTDELDAMLDELNKELSDPQSDGLRIENSIYDVEDGGRGRLRELITNKGVFTLTEEIDPVKPKNPGRVKY